MKGKWKRYYDPEWDVLLTGRSSLLDEKGGVIDGPRTIDPIYAIPAADWSIVVSSTANWRFVGDGVLATLSVYNLGGDGPGGNDQREPDYKLDMAFDLLAVKLKRDAENLARDLSQGDAKGWNSTAEHEADKKKAAARIKVLEANAIRRGDAVVSEPQAFIAKPERTQADRRR